MRISDWSSDVCSSDLDASPPRPDSASMSDKLRPRRPKVIVTRRLPEAVETRMAELFNVELNLNDQPFDRSRLEDAVARADVLVPTLTDEIDAALIGKAGPQDRKTVV